jgi:hypothetical protein
MAISELKEETYALTGYRAEDLCSLAGRDLDRNSLRHLLHLTVIFANEVGAPDGQPLEAPPGLAQGREASKRPLEEVCTTEQSLREEIKVLKKGLVEEALAQVRAFASTWKEARDTTPLVHSVQNLSRLASSHNHGDATLYSELLRAIDKHRDDKIDFGCPECAGVWRDGPHI